MKLQEARKNILGPVSFSLCQRPQTVKDHVIRTRKSQLVTIVAICRFPEFMPPGSSDNQQTNWRQPGDQQVRIPRRDHQESTRRPPRHNQNNTRSPPGDQQESSGGPPGQKQHESAFRVVSFAMNSGYWGRVPSQSSTKSETERKLCTAPHRDKCAISIRVSMCKIV